MKVILTKKVEKWFAGENDIIEADLLTAADEVINGIYDANLGGGLYKKRIANNANKGKRGGSRLLVAYKEGNNLIFMYSFNKNELDNINTKEKMALKERAKLFFNMKSVDIKKALKAKLLFEIGRKK